MLLAEDVGVDLVAEFGWETAECGFCDVVGVIVVVGGEYWAVIGWGSRSAGCWFYGLDF